MNDPNDSNGMLKSPHYILLFGIGYVLSVALYFMQRRMRLCCIRNHSVDESFVAQQTCFLEFPWQQSDNALDDTSCDGRNYQSWNTDQVTHWARSKLSPALIPSVQLDPLYRRRPQHAVRGIRKTISALRDQCIDGSSFEHLTLQHLLSFGIPFGLAVNLSTAIEELISGHSNSRGASIRSRLRSDLIALPSWYEQDYQTSNVTASSAVNKEVDVEMQSNVQQIMQDRFGMTLPSLHGTDQSQSVTNSNIEPMDKMEPVELAQIMQMKPTVKQHNNVTTQNDTLTNTDDILNNMPPQVRAIAERRPDLVSKLLSEVRPINNTHSLESIPAEQHDVFREQKEEQQYDEEVSCDTEMVGLLRRRTNNNR
jgi:hypothetical protein